jgi:CopG family nickel-responsive transcriptional regulator
MGDVVRFGVSMEAGLLAQFDELIARKGCANRSEAVRDLVRAALVESEWDQGTKPTVGTVSMVYDHHSHEVSHRLTHIQHEHLDHVVSSLHVHLDAHNCLEVLILRGKPAEIKAVADRLISGKGVKFGRLMPATEGVNL